MKTALIIEDHDDTRLWWVQHISEAFIDIQAVGAVTLAEARSVLQKNKFSLALVDINLPDGSGIDIVREIKRATPETYCIISTIFDDDNHIFSALRAGAQGYLIKDQPRDHQIMQLKSVIQGEAPLSPGVASRILDFFSTVKKTDGEVREELTEREREVLQLIAKGFSRPEAAEILGLTANTVASYTKIIYQKLNVSRRAEAVVEAIRLGLIGTE